MKTKTTKDKRRGKIKDLLLFMLYSLMLYFPLHLVFLPFGEFMGREFAFLIMGMLYSLPYIITVLLLTFGIVVSLIKNLGFRFLLFVFVISLGTYTMIFSSVYSVGEALNFGLSTVGTFLIWLAWPKWEYERLNGGRKPAAGGRDGR